jgi:hypothetical protein
VVGAGAGAGAGADPDSRAGVGRRAALRITLAGPRRAFDSALACRSAATDRGRADATTRTVSRSDDGGAISDRTAFSDVPKIAGIASAKPTAPVISAAARTRAHFSLMLLPQVVDTSI